MELINDATRLAMLKALGAEEFDTGQAEPLWGVLEGEFNDPELSGINVEGEMRWIECRLSDQSTHSLVKGSVLRRVADGSAVVVRRFEPDRSSGFLIIRLSK